MATVEAVYHDFLSLSPEEQERLLELLHSAATFQRIHGRSGDDRAFAGLEALQGTVQAELIRFSATDRLGRDALHERSVR